MPYNYSKLLGRMKEYNHTQKSLAEAIGIDKGTLSAKLNSKNEFKSNEIDTICEVLDIPNSEIGKYFFAK